MLYNIQIRDSKDALMEKLFNKPIDEIETLNKSEREALEEIRRILYLHAGIRYAPPTSR